MEPWLPAVARVHALAAGQAITLSGPASGAGDEPRVHAAGGHARRGCAARDDGVPEREVADAGRMPGARGRVGGAGGHDDDRDGGSHYGCGG